MIPIADMSDKAWNALKPVPMSEISCEQQARDLLERMDIDDAQSMTAGDVVELANLFHELDRFRNGYQGSCYTCETVGEMNQKQAEQIEFLETAMANAKLTIAELSDALLEKAAVKKAGFEPTSDANSATETE